MSKSSDAVMELLPRTSVYRKPTFSGVYLNFNSFVPISYKRNLVRCLFHRANRICSPEHLQTELEFLRNVLRHNAYPDHFITKHQVNNSVKSPTVEKKPIFLRLPFYGDGPAARLRQRLSTAVCKVFYAAKPVFLFSTTPIPVASPKDRLPTASSSSVIYSFLYGCGTAAYIGRTMRSLQERSREHVPRWLERGLQGRCNSSITEHLLACACDRSTLLSRFSVLTRCRSDLLLRITEALYIKHQKPNLCKQKENVLDLRLPW